MFSRIWSKTRRKMSDHSWMSNDGSVRYPSFEGFDFARATEFPVPNLLNKLCLSLAYLLTNSLWRPSRHWEYHPCSLSQRLICHQVINDEVESPFAGVTICLKRFHRSCPQDLKSWGFLVWSLVQNREFISYLRVESPRAFYSAFDESYPLQKSPWKTAKKIIWKGTLWSHGLGLLTQILSKRGR